jgi:hypothetical protein
MVHAPYEIRIGAEGEWILKRISRPKERLVVQPFSEGCTMRPGRGNDVTGGLEWCSEPISGPPNLPRVDSGVLALHHYARGAVCGAPGAMMEVYERTLGRLTDYEFSGAAPCRAGG